MYYITVKHKYPDWFRHLGCYFVIFGHFHCYLVGTELVELAAAHNASTEVISSVSVEFSLVHALDDFALQPSI